MKKQKKQRLIQKDVEDGDLVVEFVGFVLVVDGDGEDRSVGQSDSFRFVDFGVPFRFGELRRHIVDVFDADRRSSRPCKERKTPMNRDR